MGILTHLIPQLVQAGAGAAQGRTMGNELRRKAETEAAEREAEREAERLAAQERMLRMKDLLSRIAEREEPDEPYNPATDPDVLQEEYFRENKLGRYEPNPPAERRETQYAPTTQLNYLEGLADNLVQAAGGDPEDALDKATRLDSPETRRLVREGKLTDNLLLAAAQRYRDQKARSGGDDALDAEVQAAAQRLEGGPTSRPAPRTAAQVEWDRLAKEHGEARVIAELGPRP